MKKIISTITFLLLLVLITSFSSGMIYQRTLSIEESTQYTLSGVSNEEVKAVNTFVKSVNRGHKYTPLKKYLLYASLRICRQTSYETGKNSIYDVIKGKANCQGYSKMLFLLCTDKKIPCRLIYNNSHMWNKVFINNQWLDADVQEYDTLINDNIINKLLKIIGGSVL